MLSVKADKEKGVRWGPNDMYMYRGIRCLQPVIGCLHDDVMWLTKDKRENEKILRQCSALSLVDSSLESHGQVKTH